MTVITKLNKAIVVGAGLAGCEAAWQLARRGADVTLIEMKPKRFSPAHSMDGLAELVCSNSLGANRVDTAPGLLKEEMRRLGSVIIECADEAATPAGGALAVDRALFSELVTARICSCPRITLQCDEVSEVPAGDCVIIATGPLTDGALYKSIQDNLGGSGYIEFFDAVAPIVSFESIDMDKAYFKSRYDRGTPDYINCPMNRDEYIAFWDRLRTAQEAEVHGFEDKLVFEGCMPVEVLARRGEDAMRYGPMKPVGLRDPKTGKTPYAVVQLRRDNVAGTMYNIVGFQTHLTFPEQRAVFSMIPGLENAEFLRYGVMHRNTFINSPQLLDKCYMVRKSPGLFFAGQITGVEGYVESAASGLVAGIGAFCYINGYPAPDLPATVAIGALPQYISNPAVRDFQPMSINMGIIPPLEHKVAKKDKKMAVATRSLEILAGLKNSLYLPEESNNENTD